jgi:hypothetical protein
MKRFIREKEAPPAKKEEFKLPFKDWEVLCDENGKNCYEYLHGEDELFFDPQNIGITGKELPGKKTEEIDGKIYEYNLIGDQASKIRVEIKDKSGKGKTVSLLDLYNDFEKKRAAGEKLNRGLFEIYSNIIKEYFKRNVEADKGRNLFVKDLENSISGILSAIKTSNGENRFALKVYPSIDTPVDLFGADFFVELDDLESGVKKLINCDVTLRKQKKQAVGFSHAIIGLIDLPRKNDDESYQRYMAQVKILAQKIAYMFSKGTERVDFDTIGLQSDNK